MNIDLTDVLCAVISLLGAILLRYFIPILIQKLDQEKMNRLAEWVRVAVRAAEMIFSTTEGKLKKEYVLEFLRSKGYSVNTSEMAGVIDQTIDVLIESAVKDLKIEQSISFKQD